MAEDLQDTSLIAKLSAGDLIAIEAKYHYNCLSAYKNRYRSFIRQQQSDSKYEERQLLARAFAELMCYIENKIQNDEHILKLSHLHNIYQEHLQSLGIHKMINKTRLKRQLLDHFSEKCQEQSDGKNCLLVFSEGLKKFLKKQQLLKILKLRLF